MPAKSKSPEAAQRKVWKAELKSLEANRRKVTKDFKSERLRIARIANEAERAAIKAHCDLKKVCARHDKAEPAAVRNIDRRIAILNGRLGV